MTDFRWEEEYPKPVIASEPWFVWQNGCAVSVQANLSETKVMPELIQECVVLAGNQGCPFNFNYNELDYYEASLLVMTGLEAGDNVAGNIRHVIVVGATDSVARIRKRITPSPFRDGFFLFILQPFNQVC